MTAVSRVEGEFYYKLNDAEGLKSLTEDLLGLPEVIDLLTESGLATRENGQIIASELRKGFGDRVTLTEAIRRVKDLVVTGRLQREEQEEPPVEEPAPVHRGQEMWKEHAEFMRTGGREGGPPSTVEVKERKRTNASFAAFYEKTYRDQIDARRDPGVQQFYELNPHLDPDKKKVKASEELIAWVEEYRRTPAERVKALRSAAMNCFGYQKYEQNYQRAIESGLI